MQPGPLYLRRSRFAPMLCADVFPESRVCGKLNACKIQVMKKNDFMF
ncbi:MAG: hypothetical protein R6W88_02745 [Desulfobacterales bacterium]